MKDIDNDYTDVASQLAFDGVANLPLLQKLNILVWSNMSFSAYG